MPGAMSLHLGDGKLYIGSSTTSTYTQRKCSGRKRFNNMFYLLWGHSWPFFFIFVFSTVDSKYYRYKTLPRLDSNRRSLNSEATALPTENQPLPTFHKLICLQLGVYLKLFLPNFGVDLSKCKLIESGASRKVERKGSCDIIRNPQN